MAKELDVQTKVCKSAKQGGGYGRKISHKFVVGIPDLLVCLPPFVPCVIEMKDLGKCVDRFDRQLEVTPKQSEEMKRISAPYEPEVDGAIPMRTAMVLVAVLHRGEHRLVACNRTDTRLDHNYEADTRRWVRRETGGYYNLRPLLEWAKIAKVQA